MKNRKKVLVLTYFFVSILLLAACGSKPADKKEKEKVLNVFNWSEYIPSTVIKQFEEETGIKVNYSTYGSNEEMYAKLSVGNSGYDITVPTLFYLDILMEQGMLEEINKDNIPNLKNIGEDFLGLNIDPENDYSIPFMWGTGVIAVNEELIDKEVTGYKDLFDSEFENSIVASDDMRFILSAMLAVEGYEPNSTNKEEIDKAGEKMKELLPNIKAFDGDSPKTMLITNEAKAGILYGGEAALAIQENPAIKMVLPEEYLLLWQENIVIPKGAPHLENAEKFIDFLLRPDISKEITMSYPYANPNLEALKEIPEEIRQLIELPTEDLNRGVYAEDVGEATVIYDRVWSEIKQ